MAITWTADLNTGIEVIDQQHRRIVEFINHLETTQRSRKKEAIRQVVEDCFDYTLSHFAFEESLQEEAGYVYCKPHKKVHELFIRRLSEYKERMNNGEDIGGELHQLLCRWLVSHIKRDDADYVGAVKENMISLAGKREEKKETKGWFARFFK